MQKNQLTSEEKTRLYRSGSYMFDVPPVTPAAWNESDWIRYIDNGGGFWLTDIAKNIIDSNRSTVPMIECDYYLWLKNGNWTGHRIEDLRGYLEHKGFKKGRDIITEDCSRCLRYQHDHYFYIEVKPGLEK